MYIRKTKQKCSETNCRHEMEDTSSTKPMWESVVYLKVELCEQTIADFPPTVWWILYVRFSWRFLFGEQNHTTKVWGQSASLLLAYECFLGTNRSSVSFKCCQACELSTSLLFKMPQETNLTTAWCHVAQAHKQASFNDSFANISIRAILLEPLCEVLC